MKKIVQFGAGNIGRSLVGQLFARAGWDVVFVDTIPEIIDALNRERAYDVVVKDEHAETIRVEDVRGLLAGDVEAVAAEIADADLVGTAVGPNALKFVYPVLAQGIQRRRGRPLDVLMCENLRGAAAQARAAVLPLLSEDAAVGFVETSIGKMVPLMPEEVRRTRPLEVWAEAYNQIIADRDAFVGPLPDVPGLVLKSCFAAYVDRKLFVHNLGHAVAAYVGHVRGYHMIWQCVADDAVRATVAGAMSESGRALVGRYPEEFTAADMTDHIQDLLRRFHNQALGDTVFRVGRDLARKLAPEDRFIGAIRLDQSQNVDPEHTITGLAHAFRFTAVDEHGEPFPGDVAVLNDVRARGVRCVLQDLCGLDPDKDAALIERIAALAG